MLQYGDRMLHQNMAVVVIHWVSQAWGGLCGALCPFSKDSTPSLDPFCSAKEEGVAYIVPHCNFVLLAQGTEVLYG